MAKTEQVVLSTTVRAAGALTQQRFVGADGNPCANNAVAVGVAMVDAQAGDDVPVAVLGILLVEAGGAVAVGADVQSDANARAVTRAGSGRACGVALDEAKAEGDVIRILRGV